METIGLRFVTSGDPVSWAIREETFSDVSHVEFILDDGTTLGAHHSGGVAIRPIDYAKFTFEERYQLYVSPEQKAGILAAAHSQVGKPYDTGLIAGLLCRRDWRCTDHWDCSELVTWCFEQGKFPLLHAGKHINRITPLHIYLSPYLIGRGVPNA